jgi:hypothetical protein
MAKNKGIKVVALAVGFYGSIREPGTEFFVKSEKDVGKWMRPLGADAKVDEKDDPDAAKDSKKEPAADNDAGDNKDAPKSADELKKLIAESDDLDFLMECEKDNRTGVRKAAAERLAVLREG